MSQDALRDGVKKRRKTLGWSQGRLGWSAKITRTKVTEWECGVRDLSADELKRIERALHDGLVAKRAELERAAAEEMTATA